MVFVMQKNNFLIEYNIGILEQATVSLAAGLKISGLTPTVHTIAPFLIEELMNK